MFLAILKTYIFDPWDKRPQGQSVKPIAINFVHYNLTHNTVLQRSLGGGLCSLAHGLLSYSFGSNVVVSKRILVIYD